ncbi:MULTISPECIES: hypothetical protein [Pseudomonas]|uniref:Uncharacterized protein n=1 Tax=Pseudomonas paracarnis TaxID=2750625 RepID=A0ABU6BQD5_9PSED|nr:MULTISPECIES: hypothetical protein [Pseudomonas]MBR7522418.1 hypothetical protein [Pseudomonas juntendi]MEB3782392.1 hypothetical protein [Pseudomonas paracarnis]HDS0926258.1 hypothetical protein [Pseudomonas putida]
MIDLDKNDSQESQVSYRAKNSKEIKNLKKEVKRLRAENASLKSESKKVEVNQSSNSIKDDSEKYSWRLLLIVVLLFPLPFFLSVSDRAIEFKDKYEQCVSSKTVEANHSSILLDEIASSIIKSKQVELQNEVNEIPDLKNIRELIRWGFESPTQSVDLSESADYDFNPAIGSVNDGTLSKIDKVSLAKIVESMTDRKIEDIQDAIYSVISHAKKSTLDELHEKENGN